MKKYSVNEVAKMLDKNPETIRRWIRNGKLEAEFNSNKEGHLVTEKMLDDFLLSSPKYAKSITPLMKTPIGSVAVASTMLGSLIAKQYLKNERVKNAELHPSEICKLIREEIIEREANIAEKQSKIIELQNYNY